MTTVTTGKGRRTPAATKNDSEKARYDLLPVDALHELVEVYTLGARKYGDDNYLLGDGLDWKRVFGAMLRHAFAWARGEDRDPEDGQLHLASVAWCALTLIVYQTREIGKDPR